MARTGKKSTRQRPEGVKKQAKHDRKVRKDQQHKLKDAIDRTLAADELGIRASGGGGGGAGKKQSAQGTRASADADGDALLASFDQLRGL